MLHRPCHFVTSSLTLPLLAAIVFGLVGCPPTARGEALPFAKLYESVKPSVVYVESLFPAGAASGSGFIYASTGSSSTIVTANHVVEGASRIDVILDSDPHERYAATVQMRDHVRDIAVLTIAVGNRRALALADPKNISEGMDIAVIGYPRAVALFNKVLGDDLRPSVHTGIVSAVRVRGEIIQIDAQTDHGDSGGPIIDKATGNVIAIVRGALLDSSYLARGLEQPLPGSNYGMSVATIDQVLAGAPAAASVAAAGAAANSSATPPPPGLLPRTSSIAGGPGGPDLANASGAATTVASGGLPGGSQPSSAAYRVGYGAPHYSNADVEMISDAVLQRFANAFSNQSAFYMVPVSSNFLNEDGQQLSGACDDQRLNAFVRPAVGWRAPTVYIATGAPATLETTVSLIVTDCSGDRIFATAKTKTEGTHFSHRTVPKEIVDMSNDLLDQALADFEAWRASHTGVWDSLLKTGIPLDPNDPNYHSLLFVNQPVGTTDIRVASLFTGSPAARSGLMVGDVIESVNGQSVVGMTTAQVLLLMNAPQVTLTVRRPGGEQTITLTPEKYPDLKLARFRGHFPLGGEGSIHGQKTPQGLPAGVPAEGRRTCSSWTSSGRSRSRVRPCSTNGPQLDQAA